MKPARFRYERAESLQHAVNLLQDLGEDAKIIAGGQSLVAMMNLRLVRPEALIDVNRISGHSFVTKGDGALHIGALARHRQLELYAGDLDGFELVREAAGWVGHYPIRARGTFGGSIAHADPSSEWCMLARLFDAEIKLLSPRGARVVKADDFFHGFFMTDAAYDEVVTEVVLPRPRVRSGIVEFARRHGDFAIVAVAVAWDEQDGVCSDPRIVIGGVDSVPFRAVQAEAVLSGQPANEDAFQAAAEEAAKEINPPSDVHGSADYRRFLARGLVQRAGAQVMARSIAGS